MNINSTLSMFRVSEYGSVDDCKFYFPIIKKKPNMWRCTKCSKNYKKNPNRKKRVTVCDGKLKVVNHDKVLNCFATYGIEHSYEVAKNGRCYCAYCQEHFCNTHWLSIEECILKNGDVYDEIYCDSVEYSGYRRVKN